MVRLSSGARNLASSWEGEYKVPTPKPIYKKIPNFFVAMDRRRYDADFDEQTEAGPAHETRLGLPEGDN